MKVAALLRRAGWNLADQMVSSLTNAVLSFMVARAVDAESFGGFSVAFTVFALVIGASRSVATSPLNIRFSDADPKEAQRAAAEAAGTSLIIGFLCGIGCVIAGLLFDGPVGEALLVMGIVLPAVTTQDSFRYAFFSRGEPVKAALNDTVWAIVQLGAVGALLFAGISAVGPLVLAWGVSAACAALLATRQAATFPTPGKTVSWLREHRDMTGYLLTSFATAHGANQGAMLIIAAVGTVRANGALRGGQILLGPVAILGSAAMTFFVPEFSRRRNVMSQRQWMLAAVAVSGVMCFMSFCWGLIFLLMPDAVGLFLLGETWAATRELLLAAVVAQVLTFGTTGPLVMLYAIDRASSTLLLSLVVGALTFAGGVGGVIIGGGQGAQWGFAIANAVVIPFWYWRLRHELHKRDAVQRMPERADDVREETRSEETAVIAPRRPVPTRFFEDLDSSHLATMVLPRITPATTRVRPQQFEPPTQAIPTARPPRPMPRRASSRPFGPQGPAQFPVRPGPFAQPPGRPPLPPARVSRPDRPQEPGAPWNGPIPGRTGPPPFRAGPTRPPGAPAAPGRQGAGGPPEGSRIEPPPTGPQGAGLPQTGPGDVESTPARAAAAGTPLTEVPNEGYQRPAESAPDRDRWPSPRPRNADKRPG